MTTALAQTRRHRPFLSVYLGEQLADVLENIINGGHAKNRENPVMEVGVFNIASASCRSSDRNRTSPFAFTGNKFEFRAVGSSQSIAPVNIALNAAVANAWMKSQPNLKPPWLAARRSIRPCRICCQGFFREHMPVVFNGNGYSSAWPEERPPAIAAQLP